MCAASICISCYTFLSFFYATDETCRLQSVGLLDRGTGQQALVPGPVVGILLLSIEASGLEVVAEEALRGKLPGDEAEVDVGPTRKYQFTCPALGGYETGGELTACCPGDTACPGGARPGRSRRGQSARGSASWQRERPRHGTCGTKHPGRSKDPVWLLATGCT